MVKMNFYIIFEKNHDMKYALPFFLILLMNVLHGQKRPLHPCAAQKSIAFESIADPAKNLTANQLYYDVTYYSLNLDFDTQEEVMSGYVDISATVVGQDISKVELDLSDAFTVSQVEMQGALLAFTHTAYLLVITFPQILEVGQSFTIRVHYSGAPNATDYFSFDSYNNKPMIWSLSEAYGAREWWPCKDYPFDKADSVEMKFTVPSDMIAASNGTLFQTTTSGDRTTYWWKERHPITTYLVSIAAYDYATFSDEFDYGGTTPMPVDFYVFPNHLTQLTADYSPTVPMLEALSEMFGMYPFVDEKYGHAEYLGGGGMEHQTLSSLSGSSEGLIVHELAHQWWGDKITNKSFHHIWLHEGFATYTEALWEEYAYGQTAYHDQMAINEYLGLGTIYVENPEVENIFNGNLSYSKASWVLHMLRHVVGDQVFFDILKQWGASAYAYDVATTEDFQELCEQVSGMELAFFFEQWIYGEGVPNYGMITDVTASTGGGYTIDLTITQSQSTQLFKMPVDIIVNVGGTEQVFVVWDSLGTQSFQLQVDQLPLAISLDKNDWILKKLDQTGSGLLYDHIAGNCTLTVSAFGAIGFDAQDGEGMGFVYPKDGDNTMYFGTLMVGNGTDYVVDAQSETNDNDWRVYTPPVGNIHLGETHFSDQDAKAIYDDAGHPSPKNLTVTQRSYSWIDASNDDYVILEYTLKNSGVNSLDDVYAAVLMDFDIGSYEDDHVAINDDLRLVYMWGMPYVGIRILSDSPVANLTAISNQDYTYGGFSEGDKYAFCSGGLHFQQGSLPRDWSCMASCGSFDIASGDSVKVAFAVLGGDDVDDLTDHAIAAEQNYRVISGVETPLSANETMLVIVSPNPFSDVIDVNFMLGEATFVTVDVLSLEGVVVEHLMGKQLSGGSYQLNWNASLFPKGIYLCRITANGRTIFKKIVKQ